MCGVFRARCQRRKQSSAHAFAIACSWAATAVGAYNASKAALMKQDRPKFACARGGTSESGAVVGGARLEGGADVVWLADEAHAGTLPCFETASGTCLEVLAGG